ncbi:MucBP domain-containing protein [Lactococcus garvieae]
MQKYTNNKEKVNKHMLKLSKKWILSSAIILLTFSNGITYPNVVHGESVIHTPSTRSSVSIDEINFPDPIFREWIKANIANGANELTDSMINAVTSINIFGLGISSLEGIQVFKNLNTLQAANNNISFYDPSGNPNLKTLYIQNNKLPFFFFFSQISGMFVPQHVEGQAIWNVARNRWEFDPTQFSGLNILNFIFTGQSAQGWAFDAANKVVYRSDRQNFTNFDIYYGYNAQLNNQMQGILATVTFSGIVTAKYEDENGNILSNDMLWTDYIGQSYSTEQKDITGYTFKEVIGNPTGQFTDQDQTVTYVYTKDAVAGGDVTVKYVDSDNNPISSDVVKTGNIGGDYSTEQKDITGYTFKEVIGNPTGQFTNQDQTVTYVYTKDVINAINNKNLQSMIQIKDVNSEINQQDNFTINNLPKAGEQKDIYFIILGIVLLISSMSFVLHKKMKKAKNE